FDGLSEVHRVALPSCSSLQAEDGIRARNVTGVQTCALPILDPYFANMTLSNYVLLFTGDHDYWIWFGNSLLLTVLTVVLTLVIKIGRASWRERGWSGGGDADVETADDGALRGAEGTHGPRHW